MNISKAFNTNHVFGLVSKKVFAVIGVSTILLASSLTNSAFGANINYSGSFKITDTDGLKGIFVGDTYKFSFSLNHSAVLTDYGIGTGFPRGTLSSFSLQPNGSNTSGAWDPTGVSFDNYKLLVSDNSGALGAPGPLYDYIRMTLFSPSSQSFTGGKSINKVEFSFFDYSMTAIDKKLIAGQEFSEQFRGGLFNPKFFTEKDITLTFDLFNGQHYEYNYVKAEFDDIQADVTSVPEPGSLALLIPAALGLFGFTRHKQA